MSCRDREAWSVVPVGEPLPGDGHPHARRDALPSGPSWFDPGHPVIFGVPGALLPIWRKAADVLEETEAAPTARSPAFTRPRPVRFKHGPEQHRGVTVGEHDRSRLGQIGSSGSKRITRSRACRRVARAPSACRGARTWLAGPRRSRGCELVLIDKLVEPGSVIGAATSSHSWVCPRRWSSRRATLLRRRRCPELV